MRNTPMTVQPEGLAETINFLPFLLNNRAQLRMLTRINQNNEPQKRKAFSRAMAITSPKLISQPTYRDYHIVKQYILTHSK